MATWKTDPSFYPSLRMAMKAPAETLAYVAAFDPTRKTPDSLAVVDVDPKSSGYGSIVEQVAMPNAGDELHHFGWNAWLLRPLPERATSPYRKALSGRSGASIVAHSHHRNEARPEDAEDRQGDRA
jgi:hypothetical protein